MNQEFFPDYVVNHHRSENHVEFATANGVLLRLYVISDNIVRVRFATENLFEDDFSYAIDRRVVFDAVEFGVASFENHFEVITKTIVVEVNKHNLKTCFKNKSGQIISQDEKGFHWEENSHFGGNIVQMSKFVLEGEHYFGLGDKPTHPNLRGKRITNWAMDEYGFHKDTDPIYKCIPFYTALHHGLAYGVFFDNTFKSYFDFGSERKAVASYWADGGEMNYYFIYGPEMIDVTRQYSRLTGVPEMPPLWALGYHQCKWSYYPESQVREITSKFRELDLPCDAIYLDIDYMDGFRCFTFDLEKFPDPKKMVSDLKEQGFKTIVIIDPGIKIDEEYSIYKEAMEQNYFCRRADGPLVKGKVWPGDCYFPDFTNPKVRKWWSGLYEYLIEDIGIKGIWNDMNEPALFEVPDKTFPLDVRHDYDGHPCSHRKAHNVYGMQMSKATYKGVKKFGKPFRPFIITRSTYGGGQRYSSAWTGDNIATWEHLWLAHVQCQRMSISGFSFVGSDVGGFIEHPSPELYIRWVQLASFHAFFRTHSSGDHGNQEPWTFGEEALQIVRKFIKLRYMFLPYMYTAFYQYVKHGSPILRPIAMVDQHDHDTLYRADESQVGDHILICPILEPNARGRYIYLPKGDWYSYWDDEALKGGKEHYLTYSLEISPIFVKAGAIIPNFPVMNYVGERVVEEVTLHVYYKLGIEISMLYEDAGDGYDYEKGIYNEKEFRLTGSINELKIEQNRKGHFETSYNRYKIVIHALPALANSIFINDKKIEPHSVSVENNNILFFADESFLNIHIGF